MKSPGTTSLLLLALSIGASVSAPVQAQNILLVIADDMGLDASAQYDDGSTKPVTPTLDALASDGLVFENLWVNPTCSPTRATILSGRYGVQSGVLTVGDAIQTEETSLQQFISLHADLDYATAIVGKWHLGARGPGIGQDQPGDMGIDYYAGIYGGGVQDYFNWTLTENGQQTEVTDEYTTSKLTDLSIDWIAEQDQPWFLWLAYNAPHTPFHTPPADLFTSDVSTGDPDSNPLPLYLAAIEAMDTELQRLLTSLGPAQLADTTIIFIGDNGTPNRVYQGAGTGKDSLTQGGINVPMFVSGRNVTRTAEREAALVNGADLFPTIATLAGASTPRYKDGVSIANRLMSSVGSVREHAYSEGGMGGTGEWTVRDDQYKLIARSDASTELYDLMSDPDEVDNLLNSNGNDAEIIQRAESLRAAGLAFRAPELLFSEGFE